MKCLETRKRHGMTWRRYRDDQGVVHTTYEVPAVVVGYLGRKRLSEALARAERERARKGRNARARQLLAQGWKPAAVAHEVGLCESMVRRLRAATMKGN